MPALILVWLVDEIPPPIMPALYLLWLVDFSLSKSRFNFLKKAVLEVRYYTTQVVRGQNRPKQPKTSQIVFELLSTANDRGPCSKTF